MKDGGILASGGPGDVLRADILNAAFDIGITTFTHDGEVFVGA